MPNDNSDNLSCSVSARRGPIANAYRPAQMSENGRTQSGSLEGLISPHFLLWVFQQWWMVVIPAGMVLAAIAAAIVVYSYVPVYKASAILTIESTAPYIAFSSGREARGYIQTQLELLRSEVVLEPVLTNADVASLPELAEVQDPVSHMRERLGIRKAGQSDVYTFEYTSPSPTAAAKILNAIIEKFTSAHAVEEDLRTQQVIDILREKQGQQQLLIDGLRNTVVDKTKKITGRDPFVGTMATEITTLESTLSPAASLFENHAASIVEIVVMEAQRDALKNTPLSTDDVEMNLLIDLQVEQHEGIRARQQALDDLAARMEQIKNSAVLFERSPQWETKPVYTALKAEWMLGQENLKAEKIKVRETIITQAKEAKKAERQQRIAALDQELKLLNARSDSLEKQFLKQVESLQSGGAESVELEFLRAELARENRVFELIAARQLALETEKSAPARINVRQHARQPTRPVQPIPYKQLLLACAGAFAVPLGLALLREITVRRISDIEQLAQSSGLRVLGEVVTLPVRMVAMSPNQLSKRLRRETYIYAESINSLRTNLALAEGLNRQVLVVTSAAAGEGKTSIAVSLAMSIANASEQPTLIIDGDLRSPFVASMLRAKNHPGLFEVLSNSCSLDDAIQPIGGNGLHVLPAGHATKSTHRVLGMEDVSRLLDQLRGRFPAIVIDTPPILGASESLVLAKAADAVLFCSLSGVSQAKQVRLAIERLHHAHANVAGAVLSGTSAKRYQYVYGYYGNGSDTEELNGVPSSLAAR
jgi:polysaccharide biosynthesis transport protein